jgi:hypothetical protein
MIWRRPRDILDTQLARGEALVLFVLLAFVEWRWNLL